MKKMTEYINYIEVDKSIEELEEDFINDFISFRKENNLLLHSLKQMIYQQ